MFLLLLCAPNMEQQTISRVVIVLGHQLRKMLRNIALLIFHIVQILHSISPKFSHEITTIWIVCYFFQIVWLPFQDWNGILKPCLLFHLSFLILRNFWYQILFNVVSWKSNFETEEISFSDKKRCKKETNIWLFLVLIIAYFNLTKLLLLILCS